MKPVVNTRAPTAVEEWAYRDSSIIAKIAAGCQVQTGHEPAHDPHARLSPPKPRMVMVT